MSVIPWTIERSRPNPLALLLRLWRGVTGCVALRARFVAAWTRRGLGITQPQAVDPKLLEEGCTFVCPGIETESVFTWGICDGLTMGGVRGGMKIFNWGLPLPGGYLANLCWLKRNRQRGAQLAREIMAYQDQYPGRPVFITAQSGGVGVAVFAAEALPEDRQIEGLILLNGALSPRYDLRQAISRCRRGILNSYSPKDFLVLGWGTRVFGTTDRQFCDAAGRVGFREPANLDDAGRALYRKLHQIEWRPEFADACFHWGGHLSSAVEEYLATHVAPWACSSESSL